MFLISVCNKYVGYRIQLIPNLFFLLLLLIYQEDQQVALTARTPLTLRGGQRDAARIRGNGAACACEHASWRGLGCRQAATRRGGNGEPPICTHAALPTLRVIPTTMPQN